MRFDMYVECKNVRDSVEDTEYDLRVYLLKGGSPCLRLVETIEFGDRRYRRKSTRMELLAIYAGLSSLLDYINSVNHVSDISDEVIVYVKSASVFKQITGGIGNSLEDALVMKVLMERVFDVFSVGCKVRFIHDKQTIKWWKGVIKSNISNFPPFDYYTPYFYRVNAMLKLDSDQVALDRELALFSGDYVNMRKRYYVLHRLGAPLSLSVFDADLT